MSRVRELAAAGPEVWQAATTSPFLDGARTGHLPAPAFDRWLEQDRLFVEVLARAWAQLLVNAPTADLPILADGISAFTAELTWFTELGAERTLDIPAPPLPATDAYLTDLARLVREPYPVALAAMWAVEATYLEAWRSASPGAPAYRPFVEHWTDAAFADFVARLEAAADRQLDAASADQVDAAAAAIAVIAEHEAAFWSMTWQG